MRVIVAAVCAGAIALFGIGAATAQDLPALGPCERVSERLDRVPVNVELATVTDTRFVVTWLTCDGGRPYASDSTVIYEAVGSRSVGAVKGRKTAYHHVRIGGLKPGTSYRYQVYSSGNRGPVDRLNPGAFTTLSPPPGNELFRFAALADVHIGEEVSGLATSQPTEFPPGYRSRKPYSEVMLAAAIRGVNSAGADFTILPADGTSHATYASMARLAQLLERLRSPYLVARGSHDRPGRPPGKIEARRCAPDGDCFREFFRPRVVATRQPQHLPAAVLRDGWMFIALDSVDLASGTGQISDAQLRWLEQRLKHAAKMRAPVMIFFHHPVAEYSTTLAVPPAVFGVNQQDAQQFLDLIGDYDVRLVVNAHTHRNWIAYSPHTGRMPILEVGPTKEYPAGYSIFRVYRRGIVREWFPIVCRFCDRWRETTRGEYFSLYPLYTTGSLRDRSFVHRFDGPDVPGVPSVPLGLWPPLVPGEA